MLKPGTTAPFILRPRSAGTTLHSWLYEEIRSAILAGRLVPGSKLPARKVLARQCRVAVGTVTAAYERLVALGYLDARGGSGTYVRVPAAATGPRRVLSARGRLLSGQPLPRPFSSRSAMTFGLDRPPLDVFPLETWNRLAARRSRREQSLELLAHGHPLGLPALRTALADYVSRARGVRCTSDQVVVTCGTQHSLDLVARLLLDPGDQAWMEDPGYAPVTSLLRSHDVKVAAIPVDAHGLDCNAARLQCPLARLAYVTPGCQFPLGVPMSHERRLQLLDWAGETGAWIFEDDYDGMLRGDGRHQLALQSLDRTGCVIYSGSLSRMLFSSLRLGFLILPPAFIEPAEAALSITQRYQPTMDQATLADFITQGHFERHMQRMRELYAERHGALLTAGRAELGNLLHFSDAQVGPQLIGWLAPGTNEAEACRRAAARAIDTVALASLTIGQPKPPALVFGIGAADCRVIRTAIRRLGRVLRVLAWQTQGARSIQNMVPAPNRDGVVRQASSPPARRPQRQRRSSRIPPAASPG